MKKWILSKIVTPKRVRKIVASVISWLIYRAIVRGTWDIVLEVARWMRKLADFIEGWNVAELPADKDKLIADLVGEAITDEAVDKLLEHVAAMRAEYVAACALHDRMARCLSPVASAARAECGTPPAALPELPAAETVDVRD